MEIQYLDPRAALVEHLAASERTLAPSSVPALVFLRAYSPEIYEYALEVLLDRRIVWSGRAAERALRALRSLALEDYLSRVMVSVQR